MSSQNTRKEKWIAKAEATWGDRYDYSRVHYVNARTHVEVICRKEGHGSWPTTPDNHTGLKASGCPKCGGSKKPSFKEFRSQSVARHGVRYMYFEQTYVNAHTSLEIYCLEHGLFKQSPTSHKSGKGCPRCGRLKTRQRLEEEEVTRRLKTFEPSVTLVAGSYSGMNERFQILCSEHGLQNSRIGTSIFSSIHPCKVCSGTTNLGGHTTSSMTELLERKFAAKYEVDNFDYKGSETLLKLKCRDHGWFELQAGSVYTSPGCPACARKHSQKNRNIGLVRKAEESKQKRFEHWLSQVTDKHDGFYDYTRVKYVKQKTEVEIGCPIHGYFMQLPDIHKISGCNDCANEGLAGKYSEKYFSRNPEKKKSAGVLYLLHFDFDGERFYKIGITSNSVSRRYAGISSKNWRLIAETKLTLYEAYRRERKILNVYKSFAYRPSLGGKDPRSISIGPSECFSDNFPVLSTKEFFSNSRPT